jgi:Tol biopolymer transport system component
MALAARARLGPYEIAGPLGAGGMGEVYRAKDTRLDRMVAVKILPEGFAQHPDWLARFEREAKALAALSHPGILAVHDFGAHESTVYAVTELLEGQTLRQLLARGALPRRKAVEYAAQVAGGLAAAHAKGIVHRDLKPENLFVTTDGRVKILDFGLAAHASTPGEGEDLATEARLTRSGVVLGTAGYMSPEQAAGQKADERSDLFSLGCVLHEMLSGKQTFRRHTAVETLAAILREDPPSLSGLTPPVPGWLERLVLHCLEKRPEDRFQSARDLAFALRAPSDSTAGGVAEPARRGAASVVRRWSWPAVTLSALVVTTLVFWARPPAAPRVSAIHELTRDGTVKGPLYTDGTRVYYTADIEAPATRLLQVPVTGGDSTTIETPSFRRPFLDDILPNRNVLLVEEQGRAEAPSPAWLLSTTGGSARPLGDVEVHNASFSADAQAIVYAKGRDVFLARGDGSGSRRLLTAPGEVTLPRLSPDGRRLRYTVNEAPWTTRLWEASAEGTEAHPLLPAWDAGSGCWTSDGRYYVFEARRNGEAGLWALREKGRWPWSGLPAEGPSKLTTGPMRYSVPTISPDGHTLFALGQPPSTGGELVRYEKASGLFVPFLSGLSARDLEFSRDGRWIAYVRHPDGTLWRSRPDGTDSRQLTFSPVTALMPRWSPDGQKIAYMSFSPGDRWESSIVPAGGGKPWVLSGPPGASDPTWSPDGTKVVVGGSTADHTAQHPILIQLVDLQTGKVSAIPGSEGLFSPRLSPDGRSIAALSTDMTRLALYEFATGRWRDLIAGSDELGYPNWTRDGTRIQVIQGRAILRVRVADASTETIARLERVALVWTAGSSGWIGIAHDDSPLALREMAGPVEVYALDVEWP